MRFTKKDKDTLRDLGYSLKEIEEIEYYKRYCIYTDMVTDKRLNQKRVIDWVGKEAWLSGLARSLYHISAVRVNVYFKNNYRLKCL